MRIAIGQLSVECTLRHRWEKNENRMHSLLKDYRVGVWFAVSKAVGRKSFSKTSEWRKNLCNVYTLGVDLIAVNIRVESSYGVMHFDEK